MMRKFLFSVMFLWSVCGKTQTLFVSDIDDTIKLANVHDLTSAAFYAFDEESSFLGMSELYNFVKRDNSDIQMAYLTRAPEWFMAKTHKDFLRKGKFPKGYYIPRNQYSSDEHKLKSLQNLIQVYRPQKVILIGDNGEADASVYATIAREYAAQGIQFYQYIRILYSKNNKSAQGSSLYDGQVGFVSPLELSLELERAGFVKTASVDWIMEVIGGSFVTQRSYQAAGRVAFPYYMNCSDLKWQWDDDMNRYTSLKQLKVRLIDRCRLRP